LGVNERRYGTAVLGAGPAGLTAAHVLATRGERGVVFEADDTVGGIARTVVNGGYRFDLGGHRFFTKLEPVQRLWEETLGEEFLTRPRLSRIYYRGKFFAYPLQARDVVARLGLLESTLCALSYLRAVVTRRGEPETFEDWVAERFGRRLYDAFFRSYTEKVWGIPGSSIRSLWAAQRIKNFSMTTAILSLLGLRRKHVTTLIEEFQYPRLGPGQMWETMRDRVVSRGIPVHLNHPCTALRHRNGRIESVVVSSDGVEREHRVDGVVSSVPLTALVRMLEPAAPAPVLAAADDLRYRSLCLVALKTTEAQPFADNWIYLHDPSVRAGRVQNFGAWSDAMTPPGTTCLGAEYFCFEGDDLWELPEEEAIALATGELASIGLIDPSKVIGGTKVLVPKAYPMYENGYEDALDVLREHVGSFDNLQTCGRNGLHRYNNQDHSMWTATLATVNLLDGAGHDVWSVNTEEDYLEDGELVQATLEGDLPVHVKDLESAPHTDLADDVRALAGAAAAGRPRESSVRG
jgi:protoporphyrinogen oxidase